MSHQKAQRAKQNRSVDEMMLKLASALIRDFQLSSGDVHRYCSYQSIVQTGNIGDIRAFEFDKNYETDDIARFKADYQLESLFKRYRFKTDLYSDSDLVDRFSKEFLENQERIKSPLIISEAPVIRAILHDARNFCADILGTFRSDEHVAACRHGKRAAVGIPFRKANEAERYVTPITGSKDQIKWFRDIYLPIDAAVDDYLLKQTGWNYNAAFHVVDHLKLTLVPKTFKKLRGIMPNTTIGAFFSAGLGNMISRKLRAAGHDIRRLQEKHRRLARRGSVTGKLVTADQSLASDNITVSLVRAILPPDWFEVLNLGRLDHFLLPDGRMYQSDTFCTMGIGFTFPLQTLIFLSILKALDYRYCRSSSTISVYGDDLIYSDQLHPFVKTVFPNLGLILNQEKTFAKGAFRESCGSDFFRGIDVRPFQPRSGNGHLVPIREYEMILYKTINGLRRRWDDAEICHTLKYLVTELSLTERGILRIPPDYPDESGIKCASIDEVADWCPKPLCVPLQSSQHGTYRFIYLRYVSANKREDRHAPYLWQALGTNTNLESDFNHNPGHLSAHRPTTSNLLARVERMVGISQSQPPMLNWRRFKVRHVKHPHQAGTARRDRFILKPFIPDREKGSIIRQTGVSCHWTP